MDNDDMDNDDMDIPTFKYIALIMCPLLLFKPGFSFADECKIDMLVGSTTVPADSSIDLSTLNPLNFNSTPFKTAPLVFSTAGNERNIPVSIRSHQITPSNIRFSHVKAPRGNYGPTDNLSAVTLNYFAIADDILEFPDQSTIFSQLANTNAYYRKGLGAVSSNSTQLNVTGMTFPSSPAVLHQVQSENSGAIDPTIFSSPWLESNARNVTASSFNTTMMTAEAAIGTVAAEDLAYIAIERKSYSFTADNYKNISLQAFNTGDNVAGWGNYSGGQNCRQGSYPSSFTNIPILISKQIKLDGADGGWVRNCVNTGEITNSLYSVVVDEDQYRDSERGHTFEDVSIYAFSEAFKWSRPNVTLKKTVATSYDAINGTSNPKTIPGSHLTYSIQVKNNSVVRMLGSSTNSITVLDPIPSEALLYIGTDNASLGLKAIAIENTTGTGTSFSSLDIEYLDASQNPITPTDSNSDGFDDGTVRYLRVKPQGQLAGCVTDGGTNPSLDIVFSVKTI